LEPPSTVAGLRVASVSDIFAMKLRMIAKRGELRDYFDLMTIEQKTGRTVEEGLSLFLARYGLDADANALRPVVNALGYLDDVDDDESLPLAKHEIAAYWQRRQPQVVRSLGRMSVSPPRR
jgi:predicted nucleotidyltransferase component of viral defense system